MMVGTGSGERLIAKCDRCGLFTPTMSHRREEATKTLSHAGWFVDDARTMCPRCHAISVDHSWPRVPGLEAQSALKDRSALCT
jgi:hypothetical protein